MRRLSALVTLTAGISLLLVGVAFALEIAPQGGPPDSNYEVTVSCPTPPRVYVSDLDAGIPPATLVPIEGTEPRPGVWTYSIQARDLDQSVTSHCGARIEHFRYDVDAPRLFPGPTFANFGDFRPGLVGTAVVGTDCPSGSTASVTIEGPGGFTSTLTTSIDAYGNWEVPIPDGAPVGQLTVHATCGQLVYGPITMAHRGTQAPPTGEPTDPDDATTTTTTERQDPSLPPSPSAVPASAVASEPRYTG